MGEKGEHKKRRILIVDDEEDQLTSMSDLLTLKGAYDVVCVNSINKANIAISKSLRTGKKFNLALIDLHVGQQSGGEFARRLIDIIPDINVVIITGHGDSADSLPFQPDAIIIKGSDQGSSLLETVERLSRRPLRRDIILNRWTATQRMVGINNLNLFTRRVSEKTGESVEKIVSKTTRDQQWVSTVIYSQADNADVVNIAVSSLIGCPGQCQFCLNWRDKKNSSGRLVPFIRVLTTEEIVNQVYLALSSTRIKTTLSNNFNTSIVVNFTCEGDGPVYNLDNCAKAIDQLSTIKKPACSFILTSIGSEKSLTRYVEKYLDLPRVKHYWSVNSLNESIRAKLMPGTEGESLEKMRNLYETIANKASEPITASWIVIKGQTDRAEDARKMVSFFRGRPFKIKLMALVRDSLEGAKNTSDMDVEIFQQRLLSAGMENPIRIRKILGTNILSGCGNTVAADWVKGQIVHVE